jgi:transposase InsO family protein
VSRSGYYAWRNRLESAHAQHDMVLKAAITELHQGYYRAYGAARVHRALRQKGFICSRRRINRLMRELNIKASTTGLYNWRPGQHEFYSSTGNQLAKCDAPTSVGEQWVGDFTYIKTKKGWFYHAVVLDVYSRKVVGWAFSRKRNSDLTRSALRMALQRYTIKPGCVFHSDQGIEYAAHAYREQLEAANMVRSMSRKGNPQDNAYAESYFHTMKAELLHQKQFKNETEAVAHIMEYTAFYNQARLHSSLDYQSPENYEKLCA